MKKNVFHIRQQGTALVRGRREMAWTWVSVGPGKEEQ